MRNRLVAPGVSERHACADEDRFAGTGKPFVARGANRVVDHLGQLVDLTLAVVAINGWNRLAVAFGSVPGSYRPAGTAT